MTEHGYGKCMECGGEHGYKYDDCPYDGETGAGGGDWTLTATRIFLLLCLACPPLLILGVLILTVAVIKKM